MKRMLPLMCALCLVAWGANMASGAWVAIDDFQSYAVDSNIDGQGTWLVYPGGYDPAGWQVGTDPASGSNKVLRGVNTQGYAGGGVMAYSTDAALTMPEGATPATLFCRFRTDSLSYEVDWAFGMSHLASPTGFGSYKSSVRCEGATIGAADPMTFDVRNGPGPGSANAWQTEATVVSDQWYDMWMVVHNNVDYGDPNLYDTFDVYIQGGAFTSQTLLAANVHYFRGSPATAIPLLTFGAITDSNQIVYLDDVYVDTSDQNLRNPVPEPLTMTLLGLGGAALAIRRRRRAYR
jgi:hypothetical protein